MAEQEKIAAILWKLQRAIATQDRLIATTGDLKQSAMQRLFIHGLRGEPLVDTEIGPMPESWEPVAIGGLGRIVTGSTPKTVNAEYYAKDKLHFIAPGDINDATEIMETAKNINDASLDEHQSELQLPMRNSYSVFCLHIYIFTTHKQHETQY